ncbi:MAG: alpha/beta hydrolase [Planctomycetota bacterium]
MKPFHLQIQLAAEVATFQWFGPSAIHAAGSSQHALRADAETHVIPDPCLIDLRPLLDEIGSEDITNAEILASADEFLLLHDLLDPEACKELADELFRFLYPLSQQHETFAGVQKSDDGRAWIDPDRRLVRVWFGTDRQPIMDGNAVHHVSSLQAAEEITYGVCNVFIPKSHKPGSSGTSWWRRWIRLGEDDSLKLIGVHNLPREVFWSGLAKKLNTWWPEGDRNLFVYLHGFNVSFEDAAVHAAQIGYDLKVPGEMAFYSWPSRGSVTAYSADEATITASVKHLAKFLHELSTGSNAERIHLFVHSMGNRGLLSAMERIASKGYPELSLGQVFFCAPDEDVRTFKDKTTEFPHRYENRTLLVSPQDRAVFLSYEKHGQQDRVGYVSDDRPITIVEGMDTIEVGGFGAFDLGHGYFASAEPVIKDMREAIQTRLPAAARKIPQPYRNHFMIDVRDVTD